MAEGFAKEYAGDILDVYSAGTDPSDAVKENAVKAMQEVNIDISDQYPKYLEDIPQELDVLITMGCGVECPYLPCKFREDWGLDDPAGKPMQVFRETREIIDKKVKNLITMIKNGEIE
jgi:arsenate reductase